MGGYASGRRNGRPTVESGLTLNLSRLFKLGWLAPGAATHGILRWRQFRSNRECACMEFEAWLGKDEGQMALQWSATNCETGERRHCRAHVDLTTTPQPFGGRRWWFVCPRSGARAICLHLPPGENAFASRTAYGLAYRSQRETLDDRAFSRVFALRYKLGDKGHVGAVIRRPRGMHLRTYFQEFEKIRNAEAAAVKRMAESMGHIFGNPGMSPKKMPR